MEDEESTEEDGGHGQDMVDVDDLSWEGENRVDNEGMNGSTGTHSWRIDLYLAGQEEGM